MNIQKRGVPPLWIFMVYLISAKKWIDLRLSYRFSGYLHNSHNGASDWALRLNSYQASNWLYGLHPRVSNSHWLHFPTMTIIESGNLPDRLFFWVYKKEVVPLYVYKNALLFVKGKVNGNLWSFVHGFMRIFKLAKRSDILSVRRWGYWKLF